MKKTKVVIKTNTNIPVGPPQDPIYDAQIFTVVGADFVEEFHGNSETEAYEKAIKYINSRDDLELVVSH